MNGLDSGGWWIVVEAEMGAILLPCVIAVDVSTRPHNRIAIDNDDPAARTLRRVSAHVPA